MDASMFFSLRLFLQLLWSVVDAKDQFAFEVSFQGELSSKRERGTKIREATRLLMTNGDGVGSFYTLNISVGEPPQELSCIPDTGSFELVVFGSECQTCKPLTGIFPWMLRAPIDLYSHANSSHYHAEDYTKVIAYGSGVTNSRLAYDDLVVGPFVVGHQYFWEVFFSALDVPLQGFNVIFGLGPPSAVNDESQEEIGYFENALATRSYLPDKLKVAANNIIDGSKRVLQEQTFLEHIDCHIFSFCFGPVLGDDGIFILNDSPPSDLFKTIPVIGQRTWGVQLTDVVLKGGVDDLFADVGCTHDQSCAAILDTGTSLIGAPSRITRKIVDVINQSPNVNCEDLSTFPDLKLKLGGVELRLPPEAYIGQLILELRPIWKGIAKIAHFPTRFETCQLLMLDIDSMTEAGPMWILGDPLFREFYLTFDLGSDFEDKTHRKVHVSNASATCEPQEEKPAPPTLMEERLKRKHKIDLSKVNIPLWVKDAVSTGFFSL